MDRSIFKKWEFLRIIYNVVLTTEVILLLEQYFFHLIERSPFFLVGAIFAAIIANIFFTLGPIVESYVKWLGFQKSFVRWVLFGAGLIFSMYIVVFYVFFIRMRLHPICD